MNEDKLESQSEGYVPMDGFAARPLVGPGRWVTFPDQTVLYTNDSTVLFAENDDTTSSLVDAVVAISRLFKQGYSATEAFDLLSKSLPVSTGDLSEIASTSPIAIRPASSDAGSTFGNARRSTP